MIIRKQNIRLNSEEVSLMMSFTEADVKQAFQQLYSLLSAQCGHTYATTTPLSEHDLMHFLRNRIFSFFSAAKYRVQLADWCFSMGLRHKFILPSRDDEESKNYYYLADNLRRVGRPKGEELEE